MVMVGDAANSKYNEMGLDSGGGGGGGGGGGDGDYDNCDKYGNKGDDDSNDNTSLMLYSRDWFCISFPSTSSHWLGSAGYQPFLNPGCHLLPLSKPGMALAKERSRKADNGTDQGKNLIVRPQN